jgi:hypothetical protein
MLTISLNKTSLNNLSQTIRVTPYLLDNQWSVIERFDTISYTNEDAQPPVVVDNGILSIEHNLRGFMITVENDVITTTNTTDIYIDADNNLATGLSINGIGADYRVQNDILTRYRNDTRTWIDPVTAGVIKEMHGEHRAIISIPRWRILSRRNISLVATVADEENNIIFTYDPIEYEVRGDDDEITLSLDDPDFYVFTVHSPLIGIDTLEPAGGGEVSSFHLAIDADNNEATGNSMNAIGAEYYIGTWNGAINRYVGPINEAWWTRFQRGEAGETVVTVSTHTVELRVPRTSIVSQDGFINVACTFNHLENARHVHFYWTNHYEFNVNP